jgi:hypothetical protein
MRDETEDSVVAVAYPTERDRRIYEPGYFHAPPQSRFYDEEMVSQRLKFYAWESKREART